MRRGSGRRDERRSAEVECGRATRQPSAQRRHERLAVDRLRDVIVHPGGETRIELGLHRVRRHRDDRHRGEARIGAQRPRRGESVQLGHLHVHQDGGVLRRRGLSHLERFAAVAGDVELDPEPRRELARHHLVGLVVLGQQHAARRRIPARAVRRAPRRAAWTRAALRLDDRVEQRRGGDRLAEKHVDAELGAARLLLLAGVGADHDDRQRCGSPRARGCARRRRARSCRAASSRE